MLSLGTRKAGPQRGVWTGGRGLAWRGHHQGMAVCRVGEVDWISVHLGRWGWGLVWAKGHLKFGLTDLS